MSAQWAAGDRPLLGTDDRAGSGNRFDRHADGQPWLSTKYAASSDCHLPEHRFPTADTRPRRQTSCRPSQWERRHPLRRYPRHPCRQAGRPTALGHRPLAAPPASGPTPGSAPLSGYSNNNSPAAGSPGGSFSTVPGSGPAATYPAYPSPSSSPGGFGPPAGGPSSMSPPPGSPSPTSPLPAPPGSPSPLSPTARLLPPDGLRAARRI